MAIFATEQDIYIRQGDTGNVVFTGLPKDKSYLVYQSVYNPETNKIIKEIQATQFDQTTGEALFLYDETLSNSLRVGEWEYGLKICASDGSEDTVLPETQIVDGAIVNSPAPKFTVDYKYVEGE
ncbi:MAG: hypothetical protein MJ180_00170 [Candidatus Gastranaerophilales bacterium]|nr:hypothetical protein [Candidatus Gastranaerophilales bacterium]